MSLCHEYVYGEMRIPGDIHRVSTYSLVICKVKLFTMFASSTQRSVIVHAAAWNQRVIRRSCSHRLQSCRTIAQSSPTPMARSGTASRFPLPSTSAAAASASNTFRLLYIPTYTRTRKQKQNSPCHSQSPAQPSSHSSKPTSHQATSITEKIQSSITESLSFGPSELNPRFTVVRTSGW